MGRCNVSVIVELVPGQVGSGVDIVVAEHIADALLELQYVFILAQRHRHVLTHLSDFTLGNAV